MDTVQNAEWHKGHLTDSISSSAVATSMCVAELGSITNRKGPSWARSVSAGSVTMSWI